MPQGNPSNSPTFTGVWPILPTPFLPDETLDLDSLGRMVRFMAEAGMDGVTVLGVLGEANRLTDAERDEVTRVSVQHAGAMPVVVGATHPGTRATIAHATAAAQAGAAAVMVSASAEPAANPEVSAEYFRRVAGESPLPVILQDHPASSGVFLGAGVLAGIVRECPNIPCIKLEQPPTPRKITALRQALAGHPVTLLQGLGALYGRFELERGADGFMTGFAFPEALQALVRHYRAGEAGAARALFTRLLPLIVYEQQPGIGIRKEIYRLRGLIANHTVRHPGAPPDAEGMAEASALIGECFPGADITRVLTL